jgi:hypothetical protein
MIIGTDVSIRECKDSGYMMIQFDGRKKFNQNECYTFIQYLPDYVREESHLTMEQAKQWTTANTMDIWETYENHKAAIQSFADYHIENITDIKSYYDLLTLADIVNAYCGIGLS